MARPWRFVPYPSKNVKFTKDNDSTSFNLFSVFLSWYRMADSMALICLVRLDAVALSNASQFLHGSVESHLCISSPCVLDIFERIFSISGLILDIIFVALIKAITRRRRPVGNKNDMLSIGPDKYSFPSGHVSRACLIAYFFIKLYPISWIFYPPLLAWCVSVSYSRILLRRHHVLDVLGGVVLGLAEGILLSCLWLSRDVAFYIISYVTDEKFEGAEYHV